MRQSCVYEYLLHNFSSVHRPSATVNFHTQKHLLFYWRLIIIFRVNKTKWPHHFIIIQSTQHPPEKWQHFTCVRSHVPECPSVVLNYEWAIKFLSTLNVFHFLIMRHWGISSSEIIFLFSNTKCAKSCILPSYSGVQSWVQEFRSTAAPAYSVHKCCHLVIYHRHPMCVQ